MSTTTPPYGHLYDYNSGERLRHATEEEADASRVAARRDSGRGVIEVDGSPCYVEGGVYYHELFFIDRIPDDQWKRVLGDQTREEFARQVMVEGHGAAYAWLMAEHLAHTTEVA